MLLLSFVVSYIPTNMKVILVCVDSPVQNQPKLTVCVPSATVTPTLCQMRYHCLVFFTIKTFSLRNYAWLMGFCIHLKLQNDALTIHIKVVLWNKKCAWLIYVWIVWAELTHQGNIYEFWQLPKLLRRIMHELCINNECILVSHIYVIWFKACIIYLDKINIHHFC